MSRKHAGQPHVRRRALLARQPGVVLLLPILLLGVLPLSAKSRGEYRRDWQRLEKAKEWRLAIGIFKRAIQEHPRDAWFHVYIGHSYKKLDEIDQGLPYYEQALRLRPESKGIRRNCAGGFLVYAWTLKQKGEYERAMPYYRKAVQTWANIWYVQQYARNLTRLKRHDELAAAMILARDGYEESSKRDRDARYREFFDWTLTELLRAKRPRDGERAVRAVLSKHPWPELKAIAARFYVRSGNTGAAQALLPDLRGVEADLLRAEIHVVRGEVPRAEAIFQRVINNDAGHEIPARIARTWADRIRGRRDGHRTEEARLMWLYERLAMDRYVSRRPSRTRLRFSAPLAGHFVVGRGHGHWGRFDMHYSMDMNYRGRSQMGSPIVAVADGVVIKVRDQHSDNPPGVKYQRRPANVITLRHAGGLQSIYAHLQRGSALVRKGERVRRGQRIASMGNSGYTGGPHLHFELVDKDDVNIPVRWSNLEQRKRRCRSCTWSTATGFYDRAYEYRSAGR